MQTILIVDDNDTNLYYLETLLRGNGFAVTTARHGAEALVVARREPPALVVSDLLMPIMDGYTLLRYWKSDAALRGIPFIVYTATYTDPSDERLALDLGADAFVLKPAEPDEFLAHIRAGLARGAAAPRGDVSDEDDGVLGAYRSTLIRKLEEKSLQLQSTNAALAQATQRQALILDSIVEGIYGLELDGRISFQNRAACDLLGWPEEEMIGRVAHTLLHHHYADGSEFPLSKCAIQRTLTDGETRRVSEEVFFRRDGSSFPVEYIVSPTRDDQGTVTGAVVAFRDITEARRADAQLREQAALLDKAQDAIVVRDLEHRVKYWNRSAERLYGWTSKEMRGQSVLGRLYKDAVQFEAIDAIVRERGEWVGEVQQWSRDGTALAVEGRWTLLRDDEDVPSAVLCINTDISARKQLEQQFLRAQRMESIGVLAGGIAHDLNNVLAPIMMSIEVLRDSVSDEAGLEMLDLMATSAKRGADMVTQVLSFGRGLESRQITMNLADPVREMRSITSETFPKNITLVDQMPPELWSVEADPTQLHQVLMNLCVNARDSMPNGGEIRISAENVVMDELGAAMNIEAHAGPYVKLRVADTGMGIPKDNLERIFDPFFTTKEPGKGTGLGLATTLAIVKSHHGFIRVQSKHGRGTEFLLYFPARAVQRTSTPMSTASVAPPGRDELILVVDDELAIREVTRHVLEAHGYRVLVAADGSDAVSMFVKHSGQIQLVITDMMMPRMDGRAATAVLRSLDPTVRIIGASGLGRPEAVESDARLAIRHFLAKPYDAPTLLRTVRQALDE